jgi:general nucleoside transport system permease protein
MKGINRVLLRVLRQAFIYVFAVGLAFAVLALIVYAMGFNVPRAFRNLLTASFKSSFGFQETIKKTIPLLFATYAFSIPFMIKFFNIGAWGQMMMGGTVAAVVGLSLAGAGLPAWILVPLLLIAGTAAGGLFGAAAGALKSRYDINPIISTIMLNFVAQHFLNFVATAKPFKDPAEGHPITLPLPSEGTLGFIGGYPVSFLFALAAIAFVAIFLDRTRAGFEIRAVGHNQTAAQTFGIPFSRTILMSFFIGGALAGLGGTLETINIHGKLIEGFAKTSGAQYGIFGILTCLVVGGHPFGVPFAAFFMSVMLVGADSLQRTMRIPVELVFLAQGIIVLFIVTVREFMNSRRK